jgi:diguanylate cyclase (GGDEF)-like protein/PAS domain S-box-containing protein
MDETARLLALRELQILDSAPEREFDALVAAAALVCDVPISLVSLVDSDRQWLKANTGLPGVTQTPRDVAFCAHTIQEDGILEIPDALADPRFTSNPLVTGAPDIRFYAGAPLRLSNGAKVGTLCVIDRQPRTLTNTQRTILAHLATAAVKALESRRATHGFVASEARFRALSDGSPLGVFATDANGLCTYTNDRWQAIYGLTADQAAGTGWSQTLHPDDRDRVFAAWQRAAERQLEFEMEFRVQHADGTVRHVRARSRSMNDEHQVVTGYVGSVEDVSDRVVQNERLQRSELLLNRTGALAQIGGWELDLQTGELEWSAMTCEIHGVGPDYKPRLDEAINFYAPEARPVIQAAVEQAIAGGDGWDLELPFIQACGHRIWVRAVGCAEHVDGMPRRLVGAFQNITQSIEQRLTLENTRDRMTLATESGEIGVWDYDLRTGVLEWDPRMYRLYGLAPSGQLDAYELWTRHLHPEDKASAERALQEAIDGRADFITEFRVVWQDGSVHYLRASARVSRDEAGRALRVVGVNWDVTSLRQLAAELADQHELLRVTLQSIGDAVITTDALSTVTWLNPAAERMTGWSAVEATGRPLLDVFQFVREDTRASIESPVVAALQGHTAEPFAHHALLISRDGAELGIEDSSAAIRSANGDILGAVLVFRDVTEQRRLSGEMRHRATHDALTGLVNREEFETHLQRLLEDARERHSAHAMLFIDLDQFKLVNDTCGHAVGDQLLKQVAKLLAGTVRSRDIVARLGGDEFAMILADCSTEQAEAVAQHICDRLDDFRFVHEDRRFRIGTSIGLVALDRRWTTSTAAMQAADTSCYAAKDAGRNRVHVWYETDQAMQARHGEIEWATRIEQALDEDRFVLHAQRIEPLQATRSALHAEVLIRLQEKNGELTPPGAFLHAAERFHLATRVDRWVLRHVVQSLRALPDVSRVGTLCVNVSGQSIGDRAFHQHAITALRAAGRDVCERICLEITETAAVTNMEDAATFIGLVRALGVQIALDDFGAGASSFGYLKTLTVDVLKIDGQFIKDLLTDPLDDATVRCFVDVARVVGVKTVAEFVDNEAVLQRARELGIDYAQGFHLHRPEPLDAVLERVIRRPPVPQATTSAAVSAAA